MTTDETREILEITPVDNPYGHDHNPLNEDFHGGICPACEWEHQAQEADQSHMVEVAAMTVLRQSDVYRKLCVSTVSVDFVECCCTAENGGTYCGQPECDIYYCHDCGDEFSEPCQRHEGVNTP